MTPLRRTTPARARRGFTILEMVVVMVVLGLLLAVALPRVGSGTVFAQDQLAKASANAALDAAVHHYLHVGRGDGVGCTIDEPPADESHSEGPEAASTAQTGPLTDEEQMRPSEKDPPPGELRGNMTSCPVFVNPNNLGRDTGEITYLPGNQASENGNQVSIAAQRSGGSWRVAVAARSAATLPWSNNDVRYTCFAAVRELPDSGDGISRERYFAQPVLVPDETDSGGEADAAEANTGTANDLPCSANAFLNGRQAVVDLKYEDDSTVNGEPCTRAFLQAARGDVTNRDTGLPGAQVLEALAGCTWRYPSP